MREHDDSFDDGGAHDAAVCAYCLALAQDRERRRRLMRDDLFRVERTWLGLSVEARAVLADAAMIVGVELPPLDTLARLARFYAEKMPPPYADPSALPDRGSDDDWADLFDEP